MELNWIGIDKYLPKVDDLCLCYKKSKDKDIIGVYKFDYRFSLSDKYVKVYTDSKGKKYKFVDEDYDYKTYAGNDIYLFYSADGTAEVGPIDEVCDYWIPLDDLVSWISVAGYKHNTQNKVLH